MKLYEQMSGTEFAQVLLQKLTLCAVQSRELAVDAVARIDPKAPVFAGQAKAYESVIDFISREQENG